MLLVPAIAFSQSLTTYHYDNARTGQNTAETFLTPANVNPNQFRLLFSQLVDGQVYAQPLYVSNVTVPGKGTHNLVFVTTQGDSVYAFDADDNKGPNSTSVWHANLLDTAHGAALGATTVPSADVGWCTDISPQIGITSTPVIDRATQTLYVVAKSKEVDASGLAHYIFRLHALDITTGNEKSSLGSPVVIGDTQIGGPDGGFTNHTNVSVPGTGDGSDGTTMRFNALRQNQRVGLLLQNGNIYISSGSHCDSTPFHGWIIAYDSHTLGLLAAFNTTPNGSDGGVWMEGAGLAADEKGNLLFATGNGTFDTTLDANGFPSQHDFGDSYVKLDGRLNVLDYFTPFNQSQMGAGGNDQDLGSGGVLLIPESPGPHPHLLTEAGKLGTVYLVDRDQMTTGNQHFCAGCSSDTNIVQELPNGVSSTAVPVYWNGAVYFRGDTDVLKAFSVNNSQLTLKPFQTQDCYSGKMTISSKDDSNGIVWALNTGSFSPCPPGGNTGNLEILNAYDAVNLAPLYSSSSNFSRDNPGAPVTWPSPVAMNGKVYVGAADRLSVFGLYGIGGYDLGSTADLSLAFDYDNSGKADHLAMYRPGTGSIWILKNSAGQFIPVYQQPDPGSGIGGYDLKSPADRAFAFDYSQSGRIDHLVLYRPGTGIFWILMNSAGKFTPVYQGGGVGGYDLLSTTDQAFAFDYDGSGKLDHLVLYRPGTGTIWILKNNAGTFTPVYQANNGIGGYDLKSADDRVLAFDYDRSGKLDHLVLYRPGTGTIAILKNAAGTFAPVYQAGTGIGGYDLKSTADRVVAFDYDRSGKLDHLASYRAGANTVWILQNNAGTFAPVFQGGDIDGYKLSSADDQALSFDYDGSGRPDYLAFYRPGSSKIAVLQNNAGSFAPIFAAWEHTP